MVITDVFGMSPVFSRCIRNVRAGINVVVGKPFTVPRAAEGSSENRILVEAGKFPPGAIVTNLRALFCKALGLNALPTPNGILNV
jgi:hypothetical protein